jgi:Flp pilus assembly protein TadD
MRKLLLIAGVAAALAATAAELVQPAPTGDSLTANNLGVALMFQGKYPEARAAFVKAGNKLNEGIALLAARQSADAERVLKDVATREPRNIRAHFNLGLLHREAGELEQSVADFEAAEKLDADDLHTQYYLGAVCFALHRYPDAIRHYTQVVEADPSFVSAIFGIGRSYVLSGDAAKGAVYLKRFQDLTAEGKRNEPVGSQYGEQGQYSVAEENPRSRAPASPAIPVKFTEISANLKAGGGGACFLDFEDSGRPSLVIPGGGVYRNNNGRFETSGETIPGAACAAADFDNDGLTDLAVSSGAKTTLYRNTGKGKFQKTVELAGGPTVIFVDFDHDGYLDLLVGSRLYRNKGDGTFADATATSRITQEDIVGAAATDFDNHRDIDVVLVPKNGPPVLYSNARDGGFTKLPLPVDNANGVAVLDYNNDGWMDLVFTRSKGCPVLLENEAGRQFKAVALPDCHETSTSSVATLDYDNDGFRDIVFTGAHGAHLFRNLGNGRFEEVSAAFASATGSVAVADIDDDGDSDVLIGATLWRNDGGNQNGFLKVRARGLKDNHDGIGAKVETQAGDAYQKIEIGGGNGVGQSFTEIIFGLGARKSADFVRFLWPTGVMQDEIPGAVARVTYQELDRKGGSCPLLYAWDGTKFRFLSDIIGAGVIGEWVEPGVTDTPDPDEYLLAEEAQPRDGKYLFRFTGQMEEVTYLDAARLFVVDHPADLMVMPNEGFVVEGPPRPYKIWAAANAHSIAIAGDPVKKTRFSGFTPPHSLTLALRPNDDVLLLYGWTEYYDSSTNYDAFHTGLHPDPPKLEVPDGHGGWKTAIASMGFPAGLPKWMVVDLKGLLNRADPRVRISTNMEIYWQKAFAGSTVPEDRVRTTELPPAKAELRFLGYPRELRRSPESYDYQQVSKTAPFVRHTGAYTRYGDVTELMQSADDRYAIIASGDEIALEFDAKRLPPLPAGWKRSVIFKAEGFEKGMDYLIPNPFTVGPLPLHDGHHETPEILDYRLLYNTRVITRELSHRPDYAWEPTRPTR